MIHELVDHELLQALQYAKSINEDIGKRILIQFEIDQPMFFQTLFNVFPTILAGEEGNPYYQDLAQLLGDLNFDVLCVYKQAFGNPPLFKDNPTWLEDQAEVLNKEFSALLNKKITVKESLKLKEKFFKSKEGEIQQTRLIEFLNECVDDFVSGEQKYPEPAVELTKAMVFMVVRLFNHLYSQTKTVH